MNDELKNNATKLSSEELNNAIGGVLGIEAKRQCPVCKKMVPLSTFEQNGGYCSAKCRTKAQK